MSNIYNMTDTWSNAGVVFTSILMNVTDTASDPTSKLLDLQVGGASKFSVSKNGVVTAFNQLVTTVGNINSGNAITSSAGFWNTAFTSQLIPSAANLWEQRNGANAQTFRVFNTFTDASNNEWAGFDFQTTANVARLRMVANGTGVARPIAVDAFQKAGAAVAGDIPTGTFAVVRDTSGLTTKLIYNNAGTLMTVALA